MHRNRFLLAAAATVATVSLGGVASAVAIAGAAANGPRALAATTPAPTVTSVSVAADPVSGQEYAFWKGADGNLWQATYNGSSWSGPTVVPGMGPLNSEPAVALLNGKPHVFWQGADNNLWSATWTGSAWTGPTVVAGMGPIGSPPTVAATGDNSLAVFWSGSDATKNLWEATWNGTSWSGPTYVGMGPLGSQPTAGADSSGNVYVFWQGTGNTHVWEAWFNHTNSTWSGPSDLGQWTGSTGSAPSVAVLATGQQYLVWQGLDGNVWTAAWTGTTWTGPTSAGMGPLNSQPAAAAYGNTSTGTIDVVWKGSDLNLWTTHFSFATSTWAGATSAGMGPLDG